jgi:hypothetical protein
MLDAKAANPTEALNQHWLLALLLPGPRGNLDVSCALTGCVTPPLLTPISSSVAKGPDPESLPFWCNVA